MTEHVLWGIPPWGGPPIRITSGTAAHVRRERQVRAAPGWWLPDSLRSYRAGTPYPSQLVAHLSRRSSATDRRRR